MKSECVDEKRNRIRMKTKEEKYKGQLDKMDNKREMKT